VDAYDGTSPLMITNRHMYTPITQQSNLTFWELVTHSL